MDINKINDLKELKNYLKEKFNIDVNIDINVNYSNKISIKNNINLVKLKLFFNFFIFISFIILFIINLKLIKKIIGKNILINICFYLLIIFFILRILYFIKIDIDMVYLYYKNKNLYKNESINYDKINFNTGDIMQEVTNWNYHNLFLCLFPLKFLHNLMVIKYKNKNYILHYTVDNPGYPENMLTFNTKHIEMFLLDDYLKDNYYSVKYYRLFKTKKIINNDSIFEFLKNINYKDLKFSFMINIGEENNTYHCMSFLLKILNSINIIPKLNFQNFTSDDLIYLPELSNNIYDKPFIFEYIRKN